MFSRIKFQDFMALRDLDRTLGRLTLLMGPNGSGKSTFLKGILGVQNPGVFGNQIVVVNTRAKTDSARVSLYLEKAFVQEHTSGPARDFDWQLYFQAEWRAPHVGMGTLLNGSPQPTDTLKQELLEELNNIMVFTLIGQAIAQPSQVQPDIKLSQYGHNLAAVLDNLRD